MLNGLDLFSGIGGITKALEGYVKPVAYCEIDPYPRAVLLSRMGTGELPIAPIWDDVTTLRGENLPSIDIIYGGFPCQDISSAGRGEGLGGKRSGLFFEIMRVAEEIKPQFIFLENVANIRSKGLDQVLREIAGLGYDCRYGILSASDVGAPHRRDRWWLLAYRNVRSGSAESGVKQKERSSVADPSGQRNVAESSSESGTQENSSASTIRGERHTRNNDSRSDGGSISKNDWWLSEPCVDRMVDGLPARVDRLRALGNAVVPAQAREAFERLLELKEGL